MAENTENAKMNENKADTMDLPSSPETLNAMRRQIDAIDRQMARLFEERMQISRAIGEWKKATGKPVRDEKREAEMLDSHSQWLTDISLRESYRTFLQGILQLSRDVQHHDLDEAHPNDEGECP